MSKPKKVILNDNSVVWEIRCQVGGRGSTEVRRRFDTYQSACDFSDDFKAEKKKLRQGVVKVGSFFETTFAKESENWLRDLALRSAPGHYRRMKDAIEDFNKSYGNLEPNKITPDFLSEFQKELKRRPGRTPGTKLANASVNRITEAISATLNFAVTQRRIPFNPVSGFKKLPRNSPEMQFWDEKEAGSFLAWASDKYSKLSNEDKHQSRKNYIAYLLALNTGMRAGEIWGLKPHDLFFSEDATGDTIFVRRQFNALDKNFALLKGGVSSNKDKSRHVPCPKEVREELEALIKFNKIGGNETVFQSISGKPINHDAFADRFDRDVKQWKGRRIRFHDLRHTAATLMLSKGIDVKTVSEILGHEDISTTMIYVHLLGDRIKQVSLTFAVKPVLIPVERKTLRLVHSNP